MLATNDYVDDVRADELEARQIGAHGVPYFRIDGRYGISGAQEVETFLAVFEQVRALRETSVAAGAACDDEACLPSAHDLDERS